MSLRLHRSHSDWVPVDAPPRPVLFVNTASGGGTAERTRLAHLARERGIEAVALTRDSDLGELVSRVLAGGADALGVAGGDGSLALVASAASDRGIPFVVVPAGTRNHFARDAGVAPNDPIAALDAFGPALELTIDLGYVNGRAFLNNVSLGIYGESVALAPPLDFTIRPRCLRVRIAPARARPLRPAARLPRKSNVP